MVILISKKYIVKISIFSVLSLIILFFALYKPPDEYSALANKKVNPDESYEYWIGSHDIVWNVKTDQNKIAITFDDGPSPTYTPQIIDVLDKYHAKATFFLVGEKVEKFPETAKMVADAGHEIANHTYSHKILNKSDMENIEEEIQKADKAILKYTGKKAALFRPPGGYYNKQIVQLAKKNGYTVILWTWTQNSKDWTNPGVNAIIKNVINNASGGNIILFHDCGGNRSQTVKALPTIIEKLKEQGYELVTVSELIESCR